MRAQEFVDEDLTRRGFLRGMGAAAVAGATSSALAQTTDVSNAFKNLRQDDPRVRHAQDVADLAKAMYQNIVAQRGQPMDRQQQNQWMEIAHEKAVAKFSQYRPGAQPAAKPTTGSPSQGSEYRRARDIDNFESVAESFNQPYTIDWEDSEYGDIDALATLDDGTHLSIMFNQESGHDGRRPSHWSVEFYRNNSQEVTGEGDAQKVFATVLAAIQQFIKRKNPGSISFSASKEVDMDADNVEKFNPESRAKLYNRLVQRYASSMGYGVKQQEGNGKVTYTLRQATPGVAEEQLDELSFLGSECTKDCSGHRAGYDWSKRKGLRQANSWSPSFNKGAGLAVAGK